MPPLSDDNAETVVESRKSGDSGPHPSSASRTGPLPSIGSAPASGALPTAGPSLASIVMQSEEAMRARTFFRLTAGVVALVVGFLTILEGPAFLRAVSFACCALAIGVSAYTLRALRDERGYTSRLATVVGLIYGLCAEVLVLYFGIFTAATMVLPLGVYFFGLSESAVAAKATYAFGSILFLVFAFGVAFGLLPDLGPLPVHTLSTGWRWFFVVMIEAVFATTFFLARSSRRATEIAIDKMNRANRQVHQRDALLAEARGELDRALRSGEGRHSGSEIGGFVLGNVLGRGGMGEVYRAENVHTGEVAAVKLLHPNVLGDPDHVKRFEREAKLAKQVNSPYVPRVLGSGLSPYPYVVMELLLGHDLAAHLRKSARMPLTHVADLVDHASRALVAIREAGIVHRDLKPHNLFLTEGAGKLWKVLDFGVSKLQSGGATLTHGALVGTPSYMAPEQARLADVDHRTDLYALTSVAYRAVTGKPVFVGEDVAAVLYNVVHTPPMQPSGAVRLPEDVELVLAIGLAKDPDDRFAKAEELAEAFRAAVRSELSEATRERGRRAVAKYPWSKPKPVT